MNQELQKYIQDARKAGSAPEDIRKALLGAGWSAADIDMAIGGQRVMTAMSTPALRRPATRRFWGAYSMLFWFVVAGLGVATLTVLIVAVTLAHSLFFKRQTSIVATVPVDKTIISLPENVVSGTRFDINDTKQFTKFSVFVSGDGKKYKAEVGIPRGILVDTWNLIYVEPTLCFKMDMYVRYYCVHERLTPMYLARALLDLPVSPEKKYEPSDAEKSIQEFLPTNNLAALLSYTEVAHDALVGGSLGEGQKLTFGKEKAREAGIVRNVAKTVDRIVIPSDAFDFMKLVKLLEDADTSIFSLGLKMEEGDYNVDINILDENIFTMSDFRVDSSPIPQEKVRNFKRVVGMDGLENAILGYQMDNNSFPVTDTLEGLSGELAKKRPGNVPYLTELPKENAEYYYDYSCNDGKEYKIVYKLVNGEERIRPNELNLPEDIIARRDAVERKRATAFQEDLKNEVRADFFRITDFQEEPVYDQKGKIEAIDVTYKLAGEVPEKFGLSSNHFYVNTGLYFKYTDSIKQDRYGSINNADNLVILIGDYQNPITVHQRFKITPSDVANFSSGPFYARVHISMGIIDVKLVGESSYSINTNDIIQVDESLKTRNYKVSDFK